MAQAAGLSAQAFAVQCFMIIQPKSGRRLSVSLG
jgi:hypothetical protein